MRLVFVAIILLVMTAEGREVRDTLQSLPIKDKEKIEHLFSHLVRYESLGFVLFGETKAVAYCTLPLNCHYSIYPASISERPLKYQNDLKQCWMVWARYRHRFPHPNFIVCEEYDLFSHGFFLQLFFVNKERLEKVLNTYKEDFVEILGPHFSPATFITALEKKQKLRPLLKYDEKLLGLLLGFGRESSTAFKNGSDRSGESLRIIGCKLPDSPITPISFMGNPDCAEVQYLITGYTKDIQKIDAVYRSDRFLEEVLGKFCCTQDQR